MKWYQLSVKEVLQKLGTSESGLADAEAKQRITQYVPNKLVEEERISRPLIPEIKEVIEQRRWSDLRETLSEWPAPDIADLLFQMDKYERILIFRLLSRQISSEVFSYLSSKDKDALLTDLTDEETRQLLEALSPDDRTELLEELPGQLIQRLINLLGPDDRREALQLLGYPDESVGRLMTPDYVAVREDWTIEKALEHIRNKGKDSETINVIYVVDASWKLLDALDLRRFILASPGDTVRQIMDYSFVSIPVYEDREKAVALIQRYDLVALPVVDSEGVLLGIVTVDDVMDVAQEETTEDFHKVAAVSPLKISYSETGIWSLYKKRIGWLVMLVLVNAVSAGVIAAYEDVLVSSLVLASFIPLLIASGGNTGSQSATLVIRAIAVGDVKMDRWLWAIGREVCLGFIMGITMGITTWVMGFMRGGSVIAIVVSLSTITIVMVSNLMGVALPFLLTRLRIDPAVISNPLITSVADIAGLIIYFSVATWIFGIL